jgi:hypothetical protein
MSQPGGSVECHRMRQLQIEEVQVRSEDVGNLATSCGASANHHSPACTQCRTLSLPCHYQEGGKRGLPAAYITALEKRLADTEAALSATLIALQTQDTTRLTGSRLSGAISQASQPQRSKAEKLEDWKRLPLQTDEQLAAWLQARHPDSAAPEAPQSGPSEPILGYQAHRTLRTSERRPEGMAHPHRETLGITSTSASAIEQLRDCDMPIIPNVPRDPYVQWRENYF